MAKKKKKHSKKSKNKQSQKNITNKPKTNQNPFSLVMYHFVRIPWYIIKTFDWLFTIFTAILVYLTK